MTDDGNILSNSSEQLAGTVSELAEILSTRLSGDRTVVAIAGPPGSGKSTISDQLQKVFESQHQLTTQIVPMDGFHFDNSVLRQRELLTRKGSPPTFDIHGLDSTLARLTSSPLRSVAVPVFDRENDLSRASAREIKIDTQVILIEGNYLLLDIEPWSALEQYFDVTVMISCDEAVLRKRLMKRWLDFEFTATEAQQKVEENDLPNAIEVTGRSRKADVIFTTVDR